MNKKKSIITKKIQKIATNFTAEIINEINNNETINIEKCYSMRDVLVNFVKDNYQNDIHAEQLCIIDEFEKSHPINVLNLSIALGMKLGFEKERLNDLGIAAILHDLGLNKLPPEITKKPAKELSKKEYDQYKLHPVLGAKMALEDLNVQPHIAQIILQHHERLDGSGYPQGLRDNQINNNSLLLGLTCHYDRLSYKKFDCIERSPQHAIKEILSNGKDKYPPVMLHSFAHLFFFNSSSTFYTQNDWFKSTG